MPLRYFTCVMRAPIGMSCMNLSEIVGVAEYVFESEYECVAVFMDIASCQVTHDLTVDASTLHHFISDPVKVLTKSEVKMALCSFAERLNLSHFVFRFFLLGHPIEIQF